MSDDAPTQSKTMTWVIVLVAVIAAATPHAFFAPPLQLHMSGQMQAWLGIAVWAPAILAGVAFFFGVEFREHLPRRLPETVRTAGVMLVPILFAIYMAARFDELFSGMAGMRPWDELSTLLPVYAVIGALHALFWQGFVQHRVLPDAGPAARIAIVTLLNVAVFAPFAIQGDATVVTGLLPTVAVESILITGLFETGVSVRSCMIARALCGAAFIWFQQAMLL